MSGPALLFALACAARQPPAPAEPVPDAPAPGAPAAEERPDLPRVLVFPDGYGVYGEAPAGVPVLAVGVEPIGEGPVSIPLGEGTGAEVGEDDPPCAGNVAFTVDWTGAQPIGREVRAVDPATIRPLLRVVLGRDDFEVDGVWRIDFAGDGTEGILLHLSVSEETRGWSYVGVLANRSMTTLHEGAWEAAEVDPDAPDAEEARAHAIEFAKPSFERAEVYGLTDVEGDGALEIVLAHTGWESSGYSVSTPDGTRLGGAGCGV